MWDLRPKHTTAEHQNSRLYYSQCTTPTPLVERAARDTSRYWWYYVVVVVIEMVVGDFLEIILVVEEVLRVM